MVHACACCHLRFATTGELADHVHDEHTEHPPFSEGQLSVTRYRSTHRGAPGQQAGGQPAAGQAARPVATPP